MVVLSITTFVVFFCHIEIYRLTIYLCFITQLSQVNKSETYRCIKIAKGFRKSRKISIFVVSTNKVPNTFSYAQRYINFLRTTRNFPAK